MPRRQELVDIPPGFITPPQCKNCQSGDVFVLVQVHEGATSGVAWYECNEPDCDFHLYKQDVHLVGSLAHHLARDIHYSAHNRHHFS